MKLRPSSALFAICGLITTFTWFCSCSSGLGNNLPANAPPPANSSNGNLPVGLDLGLVPTDPVASPAIAGVVVPAIGSSAAREVLLLAFSTAAAADNGDGNGNALSRDSRADTNSAADIFVAAVCAQDVERRAFSQSLAGKFRHPRCVTCHSMQVTATLAFATVAQGHAGPPPGPTFPNNEAGTCAPCHVDSTNFPVVGWQAPAASFDFRNKTVAELAQAARNVPAGELDHFVNDARVRWALDSGILPQVGGRNGIADDDHDGVLEPEDSDGIVRTVPGGSANFLREIEDWNASGNVVTNAAAVKDITLVSRATGTSNAGNGASTSSRVVWVPNPTFVATTSSTAFNTNPIGTLYVVYESTANDLVAPDNNGVQDVFRSAVELRAEEDVNGGFLAGSLNLRFVDSTVLCSASNGTVAAGNAASGRPVIGGSNAEWVAFESTADNLVAGFTDSNGPAAADVYVRFLGTNQTQLVSHGVGNTATGGNGASTNPTIDDAGTAIAFESDASDLVASDANGGRDVFYALANASPFTKVRASVTSTGAEGTGGASSAASIWRSGTGRVLVAFQSDKTNLATSLGATTNVYLFDGDTGSSILLNQRVSPGGNAIGNGPARAPILMLNGNAVAFESDATNIDVLRGTDGNGTTDVFLVETAALAAGRVLPFRLSVTPTEGADGDGASTRPVVSTLTGSNDFQVGLLAYSTAATNLGTSDSTNVIVAFLDETSGVFADFTASTTRGAVPLTVSFTDTSTGTPTSWQWDFDNDGNVDSTAQNPAYVYATPGSYTVRLVVGNANSDSTKIAADLVLAVGTPTANFTASPATGTAPLSVTFTDTSTQSPTSWQWDFDNDGDVDSTVQNPTHVYTTPGSYSVRLIVTNEAGSAESLETNVVQVFTTVVASFTRTPPAGVVPFTVNFTDTSAGATAWSWDFDDDGLEDSTAQNPSFLYTVAGTFDVTLTATGPGGTDSFTLANAVTATGPIAASFTMTVLGSAVTSAYSTTSVLFTSTSTGVINSYAWDFDNNPATTESMAPSVSFTFSSVTTTTPFTIRLAVTGGAGSAVATRLLTIVPVEEVVNIAPNADTTIYADLTGNSNGAGDRMVMGRPAGSISPGSAAFPRRVLIRFSTASIPAGVTINFATLQMTADTPVNTGTQSITVHRANTAWTEGTASGTAGIGNTTAGGGATWNNRSFGTAWTTPGGDFQTAASGQLAAVVGPGTYSSTSSMTSSLAADVQGWLDSAFGNFGWVLRGPEGALGTAKRFWTREGATPPVLVVRYTRPLP